MDAPHAVAPITPLLLIGCRAEALEAPKELCRVESKNNMDTVLGRVESSTNIAAQ